jgi:hypothetical protein
MGRGRYRASAAVFRARQKPGVEPLRELLVHAGAAAVDERTPGAVGRGLRVMAVGGTALAVSGTLADETAPGRVRARPDKGPAGCPPVRLAVLVEAGTHVIVDAVVDSRRGQGTAPGRGPGCVPSTDPKNNSQPWP